jgi:hypothetical protein
LRAALTRQLLVSDIDSNITFSPDGLRMAFARANFPNTGVMSLIVSGADGSREQVLLTEPITNPYISTPAWSPDGRFIAYNRRGKPLTWQAIGMLLRNQLYAGIVDVPEYGLRATRGDLDPRICRAEARLLEIRAMSVFGPSGYGATAFARDLVWTVPCPRDPSCRAGRT